jgi:hypothetical protein
MRKLSLFTGLTVFALAGSVQAQDETPAPAPAVEPEAPAAPAVSESKMRVGLAFLPMLMGKAGTGETKDLAWADLNTAYGVGLLFGYKVIDGLSLGIAPQYIFGVKGKDDSTSSKQIDLNARIAYEYTVMPKLDIYAEVLPGYTIIQFDSSRTFLGQTPPNPKGFGIGFGAGAMYDVTDQFFANLGVGYQMNFTKFTIEGSELANRTKYLRIALGGGMKF